MLKSIVIKTINSLTSLRFSFANNYPENFANEFKAEAEATPFFNSQGLSPSETEWLENMNELKGLIHSENLKNFLQWNVVKKTMFISYESFIKDEYKALKQSHEWDKKWKPAIKENALGSPTPYILAPFTSANLIHHAYHILTWEKQTRGHIADLDLVFEFGGGYGSMCRLLHNLEFKGKYIIYDLPLFSALQKFYLKSIGINVLSPDQIESAQSGVFCISKEEDLLKISNTGKSLFIATWSLSEAPLKVREQIFPIAKKLSSWLIAYQKTFGEMNNADFFNSTMNITGYKWKDTPITHMEGNNYLVGTKEL